MVRFPIPPLKKTNLPILKIFSRGTLLFLFLFSSCSSTPIRRDDRGRNVTPQSKLKFAPIKKRVALLPFFNEGPYGEEDLGLSATEELRLELSRSSEYLVDPLNTQLFGSSKEVYSGGGFKLIQMGRKAKQSGINLVIFGRVVTNTVREKHDEIGFVREMKYYAQSQVELRLFDVTSGKEIYTDQIEGYVDDSSYQFYIDNDNRQEMRQELLRYSVRVAIRKAIPNLLSVASKLDWSGRIAKIIGTTVYINAGRESGIQIGDMLKVLTEGKEIYDPESGALIGKTKGEVKGTLEVTDYFGPDGATAILHSGGTITEGDYVQIY